MMLVKLLPGAGRGQVLEHLIEFRRAAGDLQSGVADRSAVGWLFGYLAWAGSAARVLANVISSSDVDRLVLTRRYEVLVGAGVGLAQMAGGSNPGERALNDLVSIELGERVSAFDAAIDALKGQIKRWDQASRYVVLDTCVYLEHIHQIEKIDFASLLGAPDQPIKVLVPMQVIDELDGAKRFADDRRGRATVALAVINRVVRGDGVLHTGAPSAIAPATTGSLPGQVTLEVLSEPLDHVRLANADAEIVDQTLTVKALAGRQVSLATFDSTMAFRALDVGLDDLLLPDHYRVQDLRASRKKRRPAVENTGTDKAS